MLDLHHLAAQGLPVSPTAPVREEIDFWLENCADDPADPIHTVTRWVLVRVPITAFGCTFDRSELGPSCRWRATDEDERDNHIRAWARSCGGWETALRHHGPVLAILRETDGILEKIDGWHRLKLAWEDGETHAWCCLGLP